MNKIKFNICVYQEIFVLLWAEMKIVFTTQLPSSGFIRLSEHQLLFPSSPYMEEAELLTALKDADVLVSTFDYKVTRQMIASAKSLKLIANFGVGYNNIDIEACNKQGVIVTNTPLPVIEPTAEHAFALMHAIAHRVAELDHRLRTKEGVTFGVMNNLGVSLYGKTLGIIGMGNIGRAIARRAIASGMQIIYHNRHQLASETEQQYSAKYVSMEELLANADYVSLNLPYTPEVHHLISKEQFLQMKRSAILINTARGAHVDEDALVWALTTKTIAGAALDVYEHEPHIHPQLIGLDNVVLSPHIGTGSIEGRLAMCENVCDNIIHFSKGEIQKMDKVN